MCARISRRKLLKDSAIVAGVAVGSQVFGVPALLAQRSPNSKLNMATIGSNGRGMEHVPVAATQNLIAVVDIDDGRRLGAVKFLESKRLPKPKEYADFRKMFDELGGKIDAVFVATPDHTHAVASLAAVRAGAARLLRKAADP